MTSVDNDGFLDDPYTYCERLADKLIRAIDRIWNNVLGGFGAYFAVPASILHLFITLTVYNAIFWIDDLRKLNATNKISWMHASFVTVLVGNWTLYLQYRMLVDWNDKRRILLYLNIVINAVSLAIRLRTMHLFYTDHTANVIAGAKQYLTDIYVNSQRGEVELIFQNVTKSDGCCVKGGPIYDPGVSLVKTAGCQICECIIRNATFVSLPCSCCDFVRSEVEIGADILHMYGSFYQIFTIFSYAYVYLFIFFVFGVMQDVSVLVAAVMGLDDDNNDGQLVAMGMAGTSPHIHGDGEESNDTANRNDTAGNSTNNSHHKQD